MIEIDQITTNLIAKGDGVWSSGNQPPISYPEGGNEVFFKLEENSFWFNHRNACILEVLRAFPPGGVFFDVGGGNGYVSLVLMKHGVETVLVEPGDSGVANAKSRGMRPIIHATLQDARFKQHVLPAVGLFDVLEHIQMDTAFLKTVRGLLQPSGRLYLTVPVYQWLWSVVDDDSGHYRRYTIKSLSEVLSRAGFEVEFASYFFSMLVAPSFFYRHLPSSLGLLKSQKNADINNDMILSSVWINRFLTRMLKSELRILSRKKALRLGASCIVVAKAKTGD